METMALYFGVFYSFDFIQINFRNVFEIKALPPDITCIARRDLMTHIWVYI